MRPMPGTPPLRPRWLAAACALACLPAVHLAFAQPTRADATEARQRPTGSDLARRPDERRRDSSREVRLFGQDFRVGGEWALDHQSRINHDLDTDRARDRGTLEQELKLEASALLAAGTTLFLQLIGNSQFETQRENGPNENAGSLERGQMWLLAHAPGGLPFDLQVGRLSLVEDRSWWWDDDLDAARIFVNGADWVVESGLARQMLPVSTDERGVIDAEEDRIVRWFGRAAWSWRRKHTLEAYWLAARDHSGRAAPGSTLHERRADPSDADLDWLGVRVTGEEKTEGGHRFGYWLDLAGVRGSERLTRFEDRDGHRVAAQDSRRQDVSGQAWDLGARWSWPGRARPTLWAGWAVGSGDSDPADGTDHAFRQTGLEENKGRFGGVKRFRYYGELMRPTLSNLEIRSLGGSLRFWEKSSVDLVVHDYRQREASTALADSRLTAAPGGLKTALGQEVDLFLAFRESPSTEVTVSIGTFRAGAAFGERRGERAWHGAVGVTVNF